MTAQSPEPSADAPKAPRLQGLGWPLFLLSTAILAQELLLIRLLAVGLWHHITYMVVTAALLAFGTAGSLLTVFPGLGGRTPSETRTRFGLYSLLFAATSIVSSYGMASADLDTSKLFNNRTSWVDLLTGVVNELFGLYLLVGLPLLFGGLAIATALKGSGKGVAKLYFANLVGSALGCFVFLVTLAPLGGVRSFLLTMALGAIAGLANR